MARLPDSFLREVQDRVSIVDLVSQYVQLTPRRGEHWGRCPFHNEKSASFKVSETRKAYKCFGCGKGGGLFNFFMELEGLGFRQAVEELANRTGMTMPKEDLSPEQRRRLSKRAKLLEANARACSYYQKVLVSEDGLPSREELERREIPQELIEKYKIGMAPPGWDGLTSHLNKLGMDPRICEEAGLLVPRRNGSGYVDRFRNRLMFPIRSRDGKVVAFGGRTLDGDRAKYLNSPETEVYVKSKTLFGFHDARHSIQREGKVLVVEGYFDVLALAKAGLGFAVATCGTALTSQHLTTLRQQTTNIVMLFDSDEAGVRAALKASELALRQGVWPTWLSVPDGKDPDDFVREQGADAMRQLLAQERPLLDFYVQEKVRAAGTSLHARAKVVDEVAPLLVGQPETVLQTYQMQLGELLGIDPMTVREQIRRASAEARNKAKRDAARAGRKEESSGGAAPSGPPEGEPTMPVTAPEGELVRLLAQDPPAVAAAVKNLGAEAWVRHPGVQTVVTRFLSAAGQGQEPTPLDLLRDVTDPAIRQLVNDALMETDLWYADDVLAGAIKECLMRLYDTQLEAEGLLLNRELVLMESSGEASSTDLAANMQRRLEIEREREKLRAHLRTIQ